MSSFMPSNWSFFSSSQPELLDTYAVVKVNIEEYVLQEIVDGYLKDGLRLHKVNVTATTWDYNIVLETTRSVTFSIYRSDNLEESQAYFKQLELILPVIAINSPDSVTLENLQLFTEHIRAHPGATLLHVAAHFGLLKLFTKTIGFDYIDAEDRETGQTPLHVAIGSAKLDTVKTMLVLNPQLDPIDLQGNNIIHYAAKSANLPILKEILIRCQECLLNGQIGPHSPYMRLVNALNAAGQTAVGLACTVGQSSSVQELLVKELLLRGANLHGAVLDLTEKYLNQHASSYFKQSSLVTLWPQLSSSLDGKALKDGGTPLHWCISGNSRALAGWLDLGVDVNARNWLGQSALHVAIDRVDLGAVILLLSSGADVNARNGVQGDSPLHLAVKRALRSSPKSSPTISLSSPSSVAFTNMMAIVQALIVFGADVNAFSGGVKDVEEGGVTARHLVATSDRSALRDQLLYVLHTVNASRCLPRAALISGQSRLRTSQPYPQKGQPWICSEGCSPHGYDFNGTPFDLPPNICLRNSPLYDSLLMEPVVEAAMKELVKQQAGKNQESESWFSTLSSKKADQKKKMPKKLKLLSLDGGGIRGLIMIQIMDIIERASGRRIVDVFDWIAGTSTGGILALMLASGHSVKECRQIYFRFKDEIFAGSKPYPSDKLEAFLQRYLGTERRMNQLGSEPRIVIPVTVVDFFPPELKIFRSYQGPEDILPTSGSSSTTPSNEELLWKVARATGAAPSFFSKFEGRYLDGGLIANNPTLDLLSEVQKMAALKRQIAHHQNLNVDEDDKDEHNKQDSFSIGLVVSLGTGLSPSEPFNALDNISLTSYSGLSELWQLARVLIEQTTSTDTHVVDRAQAWCAGLQASYFRLNPPLSESLQLNETDNVKLVHMLWQTMAYAHRHQDRLYQLVSLMTADEE